MLSEKHPTASPLHTGLTAVVGSLWETGQARKKRLEQAVKKINRRRRDIAAAIRSHSKTVGLLLRARTIDLPTLPP